MRQGSRPNVDGKHPGLTFRGSRRRLRQIRFRGNWSREMSFLIIAIVLVLLFLVPWLIRHQ
jgi:hypothetical protein